MQTNSTNSFLPTNWIKKISLVYIVFYVFFIGISCIDQIDLTLEDKEEFLVVDGGLSTNKEAHLLKLYYATGQRTKARRPVSDATINLMEEGQKIATYLELNAGNYSLENAAIVGEVGKEYAIEITLANGEIYESIPEKMPNRIEGDSVFFEYKYRDEANPAGIVRRLYAESFIATPLPQNDEPFWIKWEVNMMYSFPEVQCSPFVPAKTCYVPLENNEPIVNLLNGTDVQAAYLPKWQVAEKQIPVNDFEFRGRYYFLVNQQSITQGAYDYWTKINLIANQTGSIFDAPPAAVPGNIYKKDDSEAVVLGYFELSNTDSLRGYINEGTMNDVYLFPVNVCQDNANPFAQNTRPCCFCQLIENSSLERPSWW